MHISKQVEKDIQNSLKILNEGGLIVVHDCNPNSEIAQSREMTGGAWNGDVWKAFVKLRQEKGIDLYCINIDFGCGIIFKRENRNLLTDKILYTWEYFVRNKKRWLNLVNCQDIEKIF